MTFGMVAPVVVAAALLFTISVDEPAIWLSEGLASFLERRRSSVNPQPD
jgi:hypothetical protein